MLHILFPLMSTFAWLFTGFIITRKAKKSQGWRVALTLWVMFNILFILAYMTGQ